jgi:hypothetical protein
MELLAIFSFHNDDSTDFQSVFVGVIFVAVSVCWWESRPGCPVTKVAREVDRVEWVISHSRTDPSLVTAGCREPIRQP